MAYDASFAHEPLLKFELEEGRIYNSNSSRVKRASHGSSSSGGGSRGEQQDDFERAINTLLQERRTLWSSVRIILTRHSQTPPTKAITPSVLSGLCSFARTNAWEDETPNITVSSSELVLFCQGLRAQAVRHLKRRQRQKRAMLFGFLVAVAVAGVKRLLHFSKNMDESMERIMHHQAGGVCGMLQPMVVRQACHFMDTLVFNILCDESFASYGTATLPQDHMIGNACKLRPPQQQQDPILPICNPGKYAMHLKLRNETFSIEDVVNDRFTSGSSVDYRKYIDVSKSHMSDVSQETVVNKLVRQSIEKFSESHANEQLLNVLDFGCGLGATLYSLVPLVIPNPQLRRPSRRHSKKVMLQYTGVALSSAEVYNARALAQQHLKELSEENIVNASFALRNVAAEGDLAPELKSTTYNVIVAVESLSYLDNTNLENMLKVLYNSLTKSGIVILIDDVLIRKDPNDPDLKGKLAGDVRVQLFRSTLMRPSLIKNPDWMMLFKNVGFTVMEARDLTLEYSLVPDDEDANIPYQGTNAVTWIMAMLWRFLAENCERIMLQILTHTLKIMESSEHSIPRFITRLQTWLLIKQRTFAMQQGYAFRKDAFRTAELGYNMYILKR